MTVDDNRTRQSPPAMPGRIARFEGDGGEGSDDGAPNAPQDGAAPAADDPIDEPYDDPPTDRGDDPRADRGDEIPSQPDPADAEDDSRAPVAAPRRPSAAQSGRSRAGRPPVFALAVIVALVAQPLAAGALVALGNAGVINLAASPTGAMPILAGVFGLEIIALAIAIIVAGFSFGRVFAALLALAASSGMAMLAYVGLGCWLSGNCL